MTMTRRQFLGLVGAVAAATGLPEAAVAETLLASTDAAQAAAELTTLAQTLGPGPEGDLGYRPVVTGPGEPHVVRDDLVAAQAGREQRRASLLCFVHLTDQHIIDVQSCSRVEFLDRYADEECAAIPFSSAWRPQEAACGRITDAMNRRLRRIQVSPVTGAPITATISTGDNTDNQQSNEADLFIGLMDGAPVTPQSGDSEIYEGVQSFGDVNYWHPDPEVADRYKTVYGFPARPGWLEEALAPFTAAGVGVPWYTCYGNHDGLAQGNAPVNPTFEEIGTGPLKTVGLPPGANPCNRFEDLGILPGAPFELVTADPERRYIRRPEWMQRHLDSPGVPAGHGFTQANVDENRAYYVAEVGPIRWIVLDTVNPGGESNGSVGAAQLAWLDAELARAQEEEQLVMLFSHHGLRSLNNPVQSPDPLTGPDGNDLPRHNADDVLEVITQYTCVIAWVSGHTHNNVIQTRGEGENAFWDIGTSAHIDWPGQSRIVEVVDNRDGTLSIFGTMVDYEDDAVVSFARELTANDPQKGFGKGIGEEADRNVELLLAHPFAVGAGAPGDAPGQTAPPPPPPPPAEPVVAPPALPATGLPAGLTIGGALAVAGMAGLRALRTRKPTVH